MAFRAPLLVSAPNAIEVVSRGMAVLTPSPIEWHLSVDSNPKDAAVTKWKCALLVTGK